MNEKVDEAVERLRNALVEQKVATEFAEAACDLKDKRIGELEKENQELRKDRLDMHHLIVCVEDHIDSFNMLKPVIESIRTKMQSELPTLKDVQKAYSQSKITTETKGCAMKWTSQKPDRPGWWWHRNMISSGHMGKNRILKLKVCGTFLVHGHMPVRSIGGQWSDSPIPTPEEE